MKKTIAVFLVLFFAVNTANADSDAYNKKAVKKMLEKYTAFIVDAVNEFDSPVGATYIAAQIMKESSGNKNAVSSAGAIGLMQVKPSTALVAVREYFSKHYFSDDLYDPENNIRIGVAYRVFLERHYGYKNPTDVDLAYYRGPTGARKYITKSYTPRPYSRGIHYWLVYIPTTLS